MRIITNTRNKDKSDSNNESVGWENSTKNEGDSSDDNYYFNTDDEDYDLDDSDILTLVPPALRSHNTAGGYWVTPTGARKKCGPNNTYIWQFKAINYVLHAVLIHSLLGLNKFS